MNFKVLAIIILLSLCFFFGFKFFHESKIFFFKKNDTIRIIKKPKIGKYISEFKRNQLRLFMPWARKKKLFWTSLFNVLFKNGTRWWNVVKYRAGGIRCRY